MPNSEEPPANLPANVREEGNRPPAEEPSANPPANVREEGNSKQSAKEHPGDPHANVREEGNISGPSHPVRTPYLSENIAKCNA